MSMPIQRQSEAFGIFDDGPRFARDRSSTDLPKGLAGLVNSMGPRITGGLLNTRQAGIPDDDPMPMTPEEENQWEAEQRDMIRRNRELNEKIKLLPKGPASVETPWDEDGYQKYLQNWHDRRQQEGVPDTVVDYSNLHAPKREAGFPMGSPYGLPGPRDHGGAGPDGGPAVPDWYYDDDSEDDDDEYAPDSDPERFVPENFMDYPDRTARRGSGRLPFDRTAAVAAVADPAAMAPQTPVGGGFQAGHRVGLDWRDSTVPGTVIANDGQVHVRWDDGQYTSEDPTEVHLL